jgi:NAD(P)H-hydrate epimerase
LNRAESRRLDRLAIERYGIPGIVLMENAGRGVADVLVGLQIDGPVVICCGRGNNAGDGLVIARHLDLRGYDARVLIWADPSELTGDAATNFQILDKTSVPIELFWPEDNLDRLDQELASAAWVVDALLGTGARGNPRSPLDAVIRKLNASGCRKLAVDVPSGLDCDTGQPGQPTFGADHTCTFVAPKNGFLAPEAAGYLGQLHVLDIGAPRQLLDEVE